MVIHGTNANAVPMFSFGEVAIALWLLIKGAKAAPLAADAW